MRRLSHLLSLLLTLSLLTSSAFAQEPSGEPCATSLSLTWSGTAAELQIG